MSEEDIDIEKFRKLLIARRKELQRVAGTGDEATKTVQLDQSRVGRVSRIDALQGQAMSIEAKRRREAELKRIGAALQRIEDGDYGYCLNCGEPIAEKRLEFDPAAPLCIECANRAE